jgi:prepilin-type N-terminal cleavage/methylation domain-containing protein
MATELDSTTVFPLGIAIQRKGKRFRHSVVSEQGVTLFELLVAVLLLGIISTMIYSVLNVGIRFTDQGGSHIHTMNEKYGLLELLRRQISCAFYDPKQKKILISSDGDTFRLATRAPFQHREAGVVYAFYRYNRSEEILYYLEKRDYYNIDYTEDYVPDIDAMTPLLTLTAPISFEVDASAATDAESTYEVTVRYGESQYQFLPRFGKNQQTP